MNYKQFEKKERERENAEVLKNKQISKKKIN